MTPSASSADLLSRIVNEALALHQAGRLTEARAAYETVLARFPDQPDTLHLLGVLVHQSGDPAAAVALIGKATRLAPDFAAAHGNLGNALKDMNRLQDAAESLMRAIDLEPLNPAFRFNLSRVFRDMGQWQDAAAAAMDHLKIAPEPEAAQALLNLADMLEGGGASDEALKVLQQGLAQRPEEAEFHAALGHLLARRGDQGTAIKHLSLAVRFAPGVARHHNDLGLLLHGLSLNGQAMACFEAATRVDPDAVEAWVNLGNSHRALGAFAKAETAYRAALARQPDLLAAASQLGTMLLLSCADADAALPVLKQAAEASPFDSPQRSAYLMGLHYKDGVTAREIAAAHRAYGDPFPDPPRPPRRALEPGSPLRVGLVSGDYRRHATGFFLPPLLRQRDRSQWTAHLYSNTQTPDSQTEVFRQLADDFVDISRLSDEAAADRIRADRMDILIDLNGHTWGNRLPVLARRPAPIQATWLDYVGSSGLAQVDAVLVDGRHVPPSQDHQYREKVLRFSENLYCYEPPDHAPDPAPPPVLQRGRITFGCFNAAFKITPATIALWSRVLRDVPDARFVLRSPPFQYPEIVSRFQTLFAAQGISEERLEFHGPASNREVLAAYADLDMVLDSQPYSGGLTTLEALWMGVPVITLPGDRMAANHSAAHLRTIGLQELVAGDADHFVGLAVALARDPDQLTRWHATLRPRMAASPMTDSKAYARDFERLLKDLMTLD
ncbi:glycosyltransferase family 41 protein [Magnetospira thiophila]